MKILRLFPFFCLPSVLIIVFCVAAYGQIYQSARDLGMAGSGTARREDLGGLLDNPAGIAGLKTVALLMGYRYMYHQPDVAAYLVSSVIPGRFWNVGVSVNHYRLSMGYRDSSSGLYLARLIRPKLAFGTGIRYHSFEGPLSTFSFSLGLDIGMQYSFRDDAILAFRLREVPLFPLVRGQITRPMEMKIGSWYSLSNQLTLAMDVSWQVRTMLDVHTGFEYKIIPQVFDLRMGVSARSLLPYAGIGLLHRSFRLYLASPFHPILGVSPQIELRYDF